MKLKVCMLLSLRYEPNMRVAPQIGICTYLTHFGHQVTWIISSEKDRQLQQFRFNGAKVYAVPYRHYFPGNSLLAKIFNEIIHVLKRRRVIVRIFREEEYNIIFVRDNVFDGLAAAYIKRRYKIPFVFELSNPLEQDWESLKIEPRKPRFLYHLIARFNKFIATWLLNKADLILTTTKWFEEELAKEGISKAKLMPYPNGVDVDSFFNKDRRDVRERYHLNNSKVIIYVGTLGKVRRLGVLIQAISKVRRTWEDIKLLMVGEGSGEEELKMLASELGIKDEVIFTGQVPQSEVPDFIAAADIGVSLVPPFSFYKFSSPIKLFEYMAMAKPVIANEEIPEQKEVLEQSGGGILVPFTSEAFAAAIIELLNNPEKPVEMGRRGQEWVLRNRSYEILARQVEERYLSLSEIDSKRQFHDSKEG